MTLLIQDSKGKIVATLEDNATEPEMEECCCKDSCDCKNEKKEEKE